MTTLNDAIKAATGGGTVNDGLMAFYGGTGALEDRERAWLLTKVLGPGTNEDLWLKYLVNLGYTTGSLNDRQLAFWLTNPTP